VLINILFVWLPLFVTASVAWVALRNIKAVLIITAVAGAGLWFFSSSSTPPPVAAPPPPVIANDPPPPPPPPVATLPPPVATVVQPVKPPPCVEPTPAHRGDVYYYCKNGRLAFFHYVPDSQPRVPADDAFYAEWKRTHPNE
jgi:hypothetical protein